MDILSALLALCAGNSPVTGKFPTQRPVTRSFDFCFDLRLNRRLGKQSWGWWFETLSRPLWRHCNEFLLKFIVVLSCLLFLSTVHPTFVILGQLPCTLWLSFWLSTFLFFLISTLLLSLVLICSEQWEYTLIWFRQKYRDVPDHIIFL